MAKVEKVEPVEERNQISATATVDDNHTREITVVKNFGHSLEDAVELFGPDLVFNRFKAAVTIDCQVQMRRLALDAVDRNGTVTRVALSNDAIQDHISDWKPSIKSTERKSTKDKLNDLLGKMSDDERAAFLSQYT